MPTYKTFKRAATNFEEFASARKLTVETGLSYDEARAKCERFNNNRSASQIRRGVKMEFTAE